ncbi:MAG: type II toxin-antitoxin system prevent-host-death family antitoxin [Symploca sp. SIO2G7]|nr:type II toxin-antitoxin system prevent-host-death family antitoxin [Symploca sp. SIO2G7]
MDSISLNRFKESLKDYVKKITHQHTPIKVIDHQGQDFVVMSVEDWEQEQETLCILQNNSLVKQIAESMATHNNHQGYRPSSEEIDEILSQGSCGL